jgi:flagellin-like protein
MNMKKIDEKGVSPVIAVLLMIAIAVAAAILVYVWSMGLIGTLTTGGGGQTREQVIVDAYSWNATSGAINLYMRNVGNAEVELDAVYVGGDMASTDMGTTLPVQGPVTLVTVTPTGGYTSGVAYTAKCVTKTGGVFTFSLICGSAQ